MIASSALPTVTPHRREPPVLLAVGLIALAVSAIGAKSLGTWFLEVVAALIGAVILVVTYTRCCGSQTGA